MTYTFEPENSGQFMNCSQAIRLDSKRAAIQAAGVIARGINAVLPDSTIWCQVKHKDRWGRSKSFIVDGNDVIVG